MTSGLYRRSSRILFLQTMGFRSKRKTTKRVTDTYGDYRERQAPRRRDGRWALEEEAGRNVECS